MVPSEKTPVFERRFIIIETEKDLKLFRIKEGAHDPSSLLLIMKKPLSMMFSNMYKTHLKENPL